MSVKNVELGGHEVTDISGAVIPLTSRAQSRCVLQDSRMDSVPPEVVVPAPLGWLYLNAHVNTKSASRRNGNAHPKAHGNNFRVHLSNS